MNTIKVAITVPKDLIAAIDSLSNKSKMSRSKFISNVLKEKINQNKEMMIKEAYDRVFSDHDIQKEQRETLQWMEGLDDEEGQEW